MILNSPYYREITATKTTTDPNKTSIASEDDKRVKQSSLPSFISFFSRQTTDKNSQLSYNRITIFAMHVEDQVNSYVAMLVQLHFISLAWNRPWSRVM